MYAPEQFALTALGAGGLGKRACAYINPSVTHTHQHYIHTPTHPRTRATCTIFNADARANQILNILATNYAACPCVTVHYSNMKGGSSSLQMSPSGYQFATGVHVSSGQRSETVLFGMFWVRLCCSDREEWQTCDVVIRVLTYSSWLPHRSIHITRSWLKEPS